MKSFVFRLILLDNEKKHITWENQKHLHEML
jgi:hypothetical protein